MKSTSGHGLLPLMSFYWIWFPDKGSDSSKVRETYYINLNAIEIVVVHIVFVFWLYPFLRVSKGGRKSSIKIVQFLNFEFFRNCRGQYRKYFKLTSNIPKNDKYFIKIYRTIKVLNKINFLFWCCMAPLGSYRFGP